MSTSETCGRRGFAQRPHAQDAGLTEDRCAGKEISSESPRGARQPEQEAAFSPEGLRAAFAARILSDCDPQQTEAVTASAARTLVLAGPGAGKTRVITRRAAWLLLSKEEAARPVLVITFTRSAAAEMQERFLALDQEGVLEQDSAVFYTLHAFAYYLLRSEGQAVRLLDESLRQRLFTQVQSDLSRQDPQAGSIPASLFFSGIAGSRAKKDDGAAREEPDAKREVGQRNPKRTGSGDQKQRTALKTQGDHWDWQPERVSEKPPGAMQRLLAAYEKEKERQGLLELGELPEKAVSYLIRRAGRLAAWQRRYTAVLVDEAQDLDPFEQCLVRLLTEEGSQLFLVGDEDQSIYSFRGGGCDLRTLIRKGGISGADGAEEKSKEPESDRRSDSGLCSRGEQEKRKMSTSLSDTVSTRTANPDTEEAILFLSRNYRCPGQIVEASSRLIRHNTSHLFRPFYAADGPAGRIRLVPSETEAEEAHTVCRYLQRALRMSDSARSKCVTGESSGRRETVAVLCRSHAHGEAFLQTAASLGIQVRAKNPKSTSKRRRLILHVRACLRLSLGSADAEDAVLAVRWLRPGLSARSISLADFSPQEWRRQCQSAETEKEAAAVSEELRQLTRLHPAAALVLLGRMRGSGGAGVDELAQMHPDPDRSFSLMGAQKKKQDEEETWEELRLTAFCIPGSGRKALCAFLEELDSMLAEEEGCEKRNREGAAFRKTDDEAVSLLTFHAAKGLEFDTVWILHACEGCAPVGKHLTPAQLEEERRLFYVAMTRAKKELRISWIRSLNGEPASPSRFLKEAGLL